VHVGSRWPSLGFLQQNVLCQTLTEDNCALKACIYRSANLNISWVAFGSHVDGAGQMAVRNHEERRLATCRIACPRGTTNPNNVAGVANAGDVFLERGRLRSLIQWVRLELADVVVVEELQVELCVDLGATTEYICKASNQLAPNCYNLGCAFVVGFTNVFLC
jgi:hypothetical protein